jgi:nitrogen-specific signal transduction histidine kinase
MAKLQDGLMLFARDSRVVLVSAPWNLFWAARAPNSSGIRFRKYSTATPCWAPPCSTPLSAAVPLSQREFDAAGGKRVQVSLDFVQEKNSQIGALLIMRDPESVRRIGDEIEMSRRLSASGRLTRGVAHEVKNPINAIVLHLQLLRNKLAEQEPDTRRHMDIIDSEIRRLDRVVQTLVDFTRPRDLHLEEVDLRRLMEDVAQLAAPDAEQHGVTIERHMPEERLPIKVDVDLMKQAILNVVLNGVQAMPREASLTSPRSAKTTPWLPRFAITAAAFRRICMTRFSNSTSPRRKMAAASAWRRLIRFCSGTTAPSISNPPRNRERFSASIFRQRERSSQAIPRKPIRKTSWSLESWLARNLKA